MFDASRTSGELNNTCLRDVVALSTLPAIWTGAEPLRIAESLAASLFTMLSSELVYVAFLDESSEPLASVAQTDYYKTCPSLARSLGDLLLEWGREHDPEELMWSDDVVAGARLLFAVRALGSYAELGVIAAAFPEDTPPGPRENLLLNVGASQASTAVRNARLLRSQSILNAQLADARDKALAASHAKSTFLTKMSHELRTPLNAIIGYAELVEEELSPPVASKALEDLGRIRSAGQHLLSLITDILDSAQIEAGKLRILALQFPVEDLISEVVSTVEPLMTASGNVFDVDTPASFGTVFSDPVRLRQILLNLLSNAAKFTRNGRVTLQCTREAGDNGDQMVFRVSDNGVGMTSDQMNRSFERFYQVHSTIAATQGGTGLGLAITRELSRLLGGDVEVVSTLGQGSTFTVRIPACLRQTHSSSGPPAEVGAALQVKSA